MFDVEYNAQLY